MKSERGQLRRQRSSDSKLSQLTLTEASELVRTKKISAVELTQECLERIEQINGRLNAFITVTADSAMSEAHKAEQEIQRGEWKGPLHGIPIAIKDIIDTASVRTTAASGVFKDRIPNEDAEVVRRLKLAGAVFLGKLNLHEFAYGGSSAVSYFSAVRNPWNFAYSSGGSSGGSAAAVAARLCYAAIGTDTGGSIRQPASYCGIVGLKPTYGLVSASGVIPLSWSLDHVGPMTRTVQDAALVLHIIARGDRGKIPTSNIIVPDFVSTTDPSISRLRIGIPRAYFYDDVDLEIEHAIQVALQTLKRTTASQEDIPSLARDDTYGSWTRPYAAVFAAEAYCFHEQHVEKTPERYQLPTLKRLRAAAEVTAAKYIQSKRELEVVRNSVAEVFGKVDLLVTPTVRIPPFTIDEVQGDPDTIRAKELAMLHNTRVLNFPGLPTISVPCGFTRNGLPIGMQITGRAGDEATVLGLAYAYEQQTDWHHYYPSLEPLKQADAYRPH